MAQQQKYDGHKVNALKAKWLDKLRELDNLQLTVNQLLAPYENTRNKLLGEVDEIKKQVEEEEAKKK